MVPSGTGVLYFVVVARLTLPKQKKLSVQALQPIEDMLRKLGLGGERGYGVLQDRCTVHSERLTSPSSTRRRLRQAPLLPPAKERRTSAVIAEALMAPNERCVHLASGTGGG